MHDVGDIIDSKRNSCCSSTKGHSMPPLTATQLRNARKRRAKKKNQSTTVVNDDDDTTIHNNNESYKNNVVKSKSQATATATTIHNDNDNNTNNPLMKEKNSQNSSLHNNNSKKRKRTDHNHQHHHHNIDPSQKYSSNPLLAPIIQRAQRFFDTDAVFYTYDNNSTCTGTTTTISKVNKNKFPIYVGPIYGWRTLVKIPVRYTTVSTTTSTGTSSKKHKKHKQNHQHKQQHKQQQLDDKLITIGLFAPGSHEIIPIIDTTTNQCLCQTHHSIINDAIIHIQQVARLLQQETNKSQSLTAFSETTGDGYLRHIAMSIQRHTNLVQLVIVWNDTYTNRTTTTATTNDINNNNTNGLISNIKVPNTKSHDILMKFIQSLLLGRGADTNITKTTTTTSSVQWHSIWVHYNNTWKHANAIFTHDGKWELVYHHHNNHYNNNTNDTMNITNANDVTASDTNDQEQWNHLCPLGGITEYLTNVNEEVKEDEEYDNNNSITSTPSNNKYTTRNILTMINGNHLHDTTTLNSNNDNYNHLYELPQHIPLHFPPHVFRQGNITSFTNIIQSIRIFIINHFYQSSIDNNIDNQKYRLSCLELYGGVGTIGLHIVDLCSSFVCSDENPYNVQCFNASANTILHSWKKNSATVETNTGGNSKNEPSTIEQQQENKAQKRSLPNIRYESASASKMILERMEHLQNHIDIIIVDPPRKGMDADVCYALTKTNHNKSCKKQAVPNKKIKKSKSHIERQSDQVLIYVSCGFDAFVRDYNVLTQAQHEHQHTNKRNQSISNKTTSINNDDTMTVVVPWKLIYAEGHVLFPGSDAIETLAIFTRKNIAVSL